MTEKNKYSKSQIIHSKAYEDYRDFLTGVLKGNKKYTKDDVNNIIKKYFNEEVK
nr:MAG TPA: hypothetical protein [Bacteriophage sp.]